VQYEKGKGYEALAEYFPGMVAEKKTTKAA
jgi:hypothetical protein